MPTKLAPLGAVSDSGREDVSESASTSLGIASRYAAALFELARDAGALKPLESDVAALGEALAASADLRDMIGSPVLTRAEQAGAIGAIAKKMGLNGLTANTLALMADKRRLFVLPQLLDDLSARIADDKGEVTAEVTAAAPLSADQAKRLTAVLKAKAGKTVLLKTSVDESLIGGMVVKLGSIMIDTSVKARLQRLQNAMKEVG
jgi:F-type H+-transporting ATPase subunit delta